MPPSKQPCGHEWSYFHYYDPDDEERRAIAPGWCCQCEIARLKTLLTEWIHRAITAEAEVERCKMASIR